MNCSSYFNIVLRYTISIIIVMIIKIGIFDIANRCDFYEGKESIELSYTDTLIAMNDISFSRPTFDNSFLNKYVDDYIENNSCSTLTYNVQELGSQRVNIFLNCGNPANIIYDYKKKKTIDFHNLILNDSEYLEKVKYLLNLKYPTFVTADADFDSGIYNIKANELESYYKTKEFGDITIRINYNEIKDLLNIEMNYDDAYENEIFTLDKNKKSIAFTFDDGPADYDNNLVDLLVNAHAKATFFLVGNRLSSYPKTLEKLVNSNMEIGNHTYDHKSLAKLDKNALIEQITKTNDLFTKLTNSQMTLLRPSYGAVSKRVLVEVGMPVVLWNIDTEDWKSRNADKVFETIMSNVSDGDIVLMHSLYKSTVDAVEKALIELYKQGYQVVTVSQLAELKGRTLLAGKSYVAVK